MGFVVLPALVTDISAAYDVYFAAFKNNPITRAFFPSATENDLTNSNSEFRKAHTEHIFQYWQGSSTQYTLKCVDVETGKIVGMALWDVYLTPSDWTKSEISWLHGKEKERAEALVGPLWDARERLWTDERYLYCHVIAVHPSFQRRGVGEMLFRYGTSIAEQTQLPIYIESSKEAERLYKKTGCKELKETPVQESAYLWPEELDGAREHQDVALFVWIPMEREEVLPKHVELA